MRVLITGGTGTLGHALTSKLLLGSNTPVIFSRDEYKQSQQRQAFPDAEFMLGDVRDSVRVLAAVSSVDAVIHAAALKQVDTGEQNPSEFIETNVTGSRNVSDAAYDCSAPAVLTSSDKAVYPINVYGLTKALAERLFLSAGLSVVRYGNVLGSRGSLLDIIDKCVLEDIPIPVTHPNMTRFWWTVEEAADFVLEHLFNPGLHVPNLQGRSVLEIIDERAPGHPIEIAGTRLGEKMHEWLQTVEENPEAKSSEWRQQWVAAGDLRG